MQLFLETQQRVALACLGAPAAARAVRPAAAPKAPPAVAKAPAAPPPVPAPPPAPVAPPPARAEAPAAVSLADRLLEIVSERTGYPAEALGLDAGLEADLGIDSIKRVEIVAAFRRAALPDLREPPPGLMERLAGAKTLRDVLGGMAEFAGPKAERTPPAEAPPPAEPASAARLPFLESVLSRRPDHLLAECELSVARHPFLRDHTFFGRGLSVTDPALAALPVMPLAMMLELMAEAAVALRPGLAVAAVRDVRLLRRLTFEDPTRRVRMEARAEDDGSVHGVLYEADREGMAAVIAEAAFELTAAPPDLGPPAVADEAGAAPPWPAEDLYGRTLYHGPAFQGVVSIDACARHAVRASVSEPDPARLLPPGVEPNLVLPVVLMDVAGQVAGMAVRPEWTAEEVHLTFPSRIERLEFARPRRPGTALRAVARVRQDGAHDVSDVEITGSDGETVLRALGRTEGHVRLPAGLYRYWTAPREVTLSRALGEPFRDVHGAEGCTVAAVEDLGGKVLVNRLWQEVLASLILGEEERDAFAGLKLLPEPAASWLLGRAAAKDAVRLRAGADVCMADVAIRTGEHGRPGAALPAGPAPLLSLAHKGLAAVAVAADPGRFESAGIDLEPLGAVDAVVKETAFSAAERSVVEAAARASGEPADQWYLSARAAKEALGKALGRGVLGGPRSVEVVAIDAATGRLTLALRGPLAEAFPRHAARGSFDAYRRLHGRHVLALCLLPAAAGTSD
jgi:4'-phosphopantetheinyl transferase EntD